MADNTTPQPSPSPLSISLKGAFSTRWNYKPHNLYNYAYDKLKHIKFLGIGTYAGSKLPDILQAVLVKVGGGGGADNTVYGMERHKNHDSLVGEALSGTNNNDNTFEYLGDDLLGYRTTLLKDAIDGLRDSTVLASGDTSKSGAVQELVAAIAQRQIDGVVSETVQYAKSFNLQDMDVLELLSTKLSRIKMVSSMAEFVIASKVGEAQEIRADEGAVRYVIKAAEVLESASLLIEKAHEGNELTHYVLMKYVSHYATDVEGMLSTYAQNVGVNGADILDAYRRLVDKVLDTFSDHQDLVKAEKIAFGDQVGTVGFEKMVQESLDKVHAELFIRDVGKHYANVAEYTTANNTESRFATIEFDHDLVADDSIGYKVLLDGIYQDFVRVMDSKHAMEHGLLPYDVVRDSKESVIEYALSGASRNSNPKESTDSVGESLAVESTVRLATEDFYQYSSMGWSDDDYQEPNVLIHPEFWGELADSDNPIPISTSFDEAIFGELTDSEDASVTVVLEPMEFWAELSDNEDDTPATLLDYGIGEWAELNSDRGDDNYIPDEEPVLAVKTWDVFVDKDKQDGHEIAVLSCTPPDWRFTHRPPLQPDPPVPEPVFEHVCEHYVCEDWLHFPLVEYAGGVTDFHDDNCNPRFPTGEYDSDGNPYVLPPYTILNEPIGGGADVGGKQMMAINPCNLYDVINYIVKIYDSYKPRFAGSTPVDSMSRVMNLVYDEIQKLVQAWDGTQQYTPDEMWRIYRFIRWMAVGVTNMFYKVKLIMEYGDFVETFETPPPSSMFTYQGGMVRQTTASMVYDGHPMLESQQNTAEIGFKVPQSTGSSVVSFDIGNIVDTRPSVNQSQTFIDEDFSGDPAHYKIVGDGWVSREADWYGIAVEEPAQQRTYSTTTFTVPASLVGQADLTFAYGLDTNLDTKLRLMNGATEVWHSDISNSAGYHAVDLQVGAGTYHWEVNVPQAITNQQVPISFSTQQIHDQWKQTGSYDDWTVSGDTIYATQNTGSTALVINPAWMNDSSYIIEAEFMTSGGPSGQEDFIGLVFNYKDDFNYYLAGMWARTSTWMVGNYSGVWKIDRGRGKIDNFNQSPTWPCPIPQRWDFNVWYKLHIEVNGTHVKVLLNGQPFVEFDDYSGWTGASGLAAFSNPYSTFRNVKYYSVPRFRCMVDDIKATGTVSVAQDAPSYSIDFFLDDTNTPRISAYSNNAKQTFSFPILVGEHKAKWVFKKQGSQPSVDGDVSFVDNILIKKVKVTGCHTQEEFIGCGGHFAVKWLIDNLLEYYKRHHQACKGRRDIWIIE